MCIISSIFFLDDPIESLTAGWLAGCVVAINLYMDMFVAGSLVGKESDLHGTDLESLDTGKARKANFTKLQKKQ